MGKWFSKNNLKLTKMKHIYLNFYKLCNLKNSNNRLYNLNYKTHNSSHQKCTRIRASKKHYKLILKATLEYFLHRHNIVYLRIQNQYMKNDKCLLELKIILFPNSRMGCLLQLKHYMEQ